MNAVTESRTVGEIVAQHPAAARVFERHAIDYCCGGNTPLASACERRGVRLDEVLRELEDALAPKQPSDEADWSHASAGVLIDHIEATHHAWLRRELPRARELIAAVVRAHGDQDPSLIELAATFDVFESDIFAHFRKEELVLFPAIRSLETALEPAGGAGGAGGAIEAPIRAMMAEHESSGEALRRMRSLTNDFTPPPDACNTYLAMIDALTSIERDTHRHVHTENNILIPKARAMAAARRGTLNRT